jgi:hypothetical protein
MASTYVAQSITHAGSQPTWTAPAASGDQAPTGASLYLVVFNGSVSSITVTLPFTPTYDGQGVTSRTVSVPASTLAAPAPVFIPLPDGVYGVGLTAVNYSAVTTVSVFVLRVSAS